MTDQGSADTHSTYGARTTSIGSPTRVITKAGPTPMVVDTVLERGGSGEVPNAGELFLGGVTSCAILIFVELADEEDLPLTHVSAEIEAVAKKEYDPEGTRSFESVKITLSFEGVTAEQAQSMVDVFRARCPLYGTLALAVPDTEIELSVTKAR